MNRFNQKQALLNAVNLAVTLADHFDDVTIDKQYFEEMEEYPTIFDLLLAVSITLTSELKESTNE